MADQADEQIAEAQSVPTSALAYLGFDPNAWEATPSNGYGYPYDLRTYTSGGTPVYLGLAGGANAPAGAVSLQGADRQQTTQLLAGFLASHGGLSSLAHWAAPTLDFVAMGDSFTSGESNSPFQKTGSHFGYNSSSDGCHRSGAAYAYALGRALPYAVYSGGAVSGSNVQLIACSGAWTSDITTNGRDGERPQTQQLQVIDGEVFKRNPDLVTFTAGGNDAGFVGILEHCAWQHFLGYYHLGSYCADESGFVAQTTNRIVTLGPTLQQAYAEMAAGLGPDTSVMVADYPQIFPSKSDGDQGCVPRWFAGRDQDQFRLWTALLDVQVSKAARADGLNFVNVLSNGEFAGHEICGNGGSYFNGLTDNGTGSLWTLTRWQGSFHPNHLGQNAYAYSFEDYILQAHLQHVPLTAAGLPVDPKFGGTQVTPNALQPAARAAEPALASAADGATLAFGDLAVASQQSQSCLESYEQGQTITLTGGGFASGALVTVALEPGWTQSVTQVVTADADGQISATIQIPSNLAGPQQSVGDAPMGYVEADGAGGSSTNQMDNIAFNILPAGTMCANPEPAPASATITLTGDSPAVPAVGAVFAITGPGLPQPDAAHTPGTFAELDIATDGSTICPAAEPSGASCVSGIIGGLEPGGTYTATEVSAPPGYTGADAQTFTAPSDGSTTSVAFDNLYAGPPVAGGVTVNLTGADGAPLEGGATFAITGPGLPPVRDGVPAPGTFAEVDVDSDGVPGCAPTEPAGVTCGDGLVSGLQAGATYTVSEVGPPPGYAATAPVTVTASGDGRPVLASFVNVAVASLPTAGVSLRLASDGTSTLPLANAVFAVSGPGLPALGTAADAGSFAELDTGPAGEAVCPQAEPGGVSCANAAITGLAAGSLYTITEVHAPAGYAPAASQQFITSTTGATTTVAITNTAQIQPAIDWASPRLISYGTPLSSAQLDATSSVSGTFSYDPTPGTVLGAGSHTLSVTFTPDDGVHYTTADATVTLDVEPATPTITWVNPDAITYGTPLSPTQLDATASVPGTFAYTPAAGVMLGAGSHTLSLTFTPDDETDYTTATAVVTLVVDKATPTVNWPSPAPLLYGQQLSSTQFAATASVPGDFTYSPLPGVVVDPGAHQLTLTFTPEDGADYNVVVLTAEVNVGFSQPCITANRAGPLTIRSGQAICVGQGGRIAGPINVEAGGALWVDGGSLAGPLSAKPGSTISINSGTLIGPLNANGAQLVEVCGSRLTGPVTVNATTGAVELGGQGCVGDTITGPVDVESNTGGASVVDNTVTGPLTITGNTGGFQYSGNSVTGPVNVSNNT